MRGIKLKGDDRVVGGCAVAHEEIVVIATAEGYAKRTEVDEFPVQARGGSGLKAAKIDKARGAPGNLSSSLRLYVLEALKRKISRA